MTWFASIPIKTSPAALLDRYEVFLYKLVVFAVTFVSVFVLGRFVVPLVERVLSSKRVTPTIRQPSERSVLPSTSSRFSPGSFRSLTNHDIKDQFRIDYPFTVPFGGDLPTIKHIFLDEAAANPRILADPESTSSFGFGSPTRAARSSLGVLSGGRGAFRIQGFRDVA
ncbi:hypothetical protein C451_03954 [Halococcus thailandensis JCM 13552]|uniref:Uncharacterized protein n=1 Tax=Halococcus thailandensis JCM 13552 TaxID=1227457 RepID=M0NGD0_9EURY|nr:hypothetical protein C451_03954 [Halococcus thailandensis JCM 13552]